MRGKLLRLFAVAVVLGILVYTGIVGMIIYCQGKARVTKPSDCIIVLGARVRPDGTLSDSLRYRCESALEAWEQGLSKEIIVCGGRGRDEPTTEAVAMRDYFMAHGVPAANIHLEDTSTDTHQNIDNARRIMDARQWNSAVIVTSDYHLERALWHARDAGIDACGVPSESPKTKRSYISARLREGLSWIAYFMHIS